PRSARAAPSRCAAGVGSTPVSRASTRASAAGWAQSSPCRQTVVSEAVRQLRRSASCGSKGSVTSVTTDERGELGDYDATLRDQFGRCCGVPRAACCMALFLWCGVITADGRGSHMSDVTRVPEGIASDAELITAVRQGDTAAFG